jgi:adenylate kinase family enzyme
MRIILFGNAGAGKSTMAKELIGDRNIERLSLDDIAWDVGIQRKPILESQKLLDAFLQDNDHWIIEGCYSDLIEYALPHCEELIFLNPGVDVCKKHCQSRPWEPEKFNSPEEQQSMLSSLLEWVSKYETREDEYGLKRHRQIFNEFSGSKREYTNVSEYKEE